jgi:hypothetical protein
MAARVCALEHPWIAQRLAVTMVQLAETTTELERMRRRKVVRAELLRHPFRRRA